MANDIKDNAQELLDYTSLLGATTAGIADLKLVHGLKTYGGVNLKDFKYGISIAIGLPSVAMEMIREDDPGILYAWAYKTANVALDAIALKIAALISGRGHLALVIPASMRIDVERQVGHVSHKAVAWAAGIGWIGRNDLLINPTYGSRLRFATVLTDIPLACDAPIKNQCGECRLCIEICPSKALKYLKFEDHPPTREDIFDPSKCAARLTKMKEQFLKQPVLAEYAVSVCGICIRVCPYGKPRRK